MNMIEKYNLPNDFEVSLIENSISLEEIGINALGWKYNDIFNVVDSLCDKHYAILGGDIYSIKENGYESTLDNWYINRDEMSWNDFVNASNKKTVEYLSAYNSRNKDKLNQLLYVLVFQREQ